MFSTHDLSFIYPTYRSIKIKYFKIILKVNESVNDDEKKKLSKLPRV